MSAIGSTWSNHLIGVFHLETLAIHGGIFLGIVWLLRSDSVRGVLLTVTAFLLLGGAYGAAAFKIGGWNGVLELAGLALATHGGLLWVSGAHRVSAGVEITVRLIVGVLALTVAVGVTGVPEAAMDWHTHPRAVLLAGAIFFGLLGIVEASGVYVAIRRIGDEEAAKEERTTASS